MYSLRNHLNEWMILFSICQEIWTNNLKLDGLQSKIVWILKYLYHNCFFYRCRIQWSNLARYRWSRYQWWWRPLTATWPEVVEQPSRAPHTSLAADSNVRQRHLQTAMWRALTVRLGCPWSSDLCTRPTGTRAAQSLLVAEQRRQSLRFRTVVQWTTMTAVAGQWTLGSTKRDVCERLTVV